MSIRRSGWLAGRGWCGPSTFEQQSDEAEQPAPGFITQFECAGPRDSNGAKL